MPSFNYVQTRIEEVAGEPVSFDEYTSHDEVDVHDALMLVEATKLQSPMADHHELFFRGRDSDTTYCKARYFVFADASIAHIDWVEVDKAIRGNGVGRLVRRAILDTLEQTDAVYSKIINDRLISVAIDQGFKQIQHGDLEGWFVRE